MDRGGPQRRRGFLLIVASPHTARGQTGTTDTEGNLAIYESNSQEFEERKKNHHPLQPNPLIVHINVLNLG